VAPYSQSSKLYKPYKPGSSYSTLGVEENKMIHRVINDADVIV